MSQKNIKGFEIKNSPIAWFYILEDARRHGDFNRAAEAQRELARLGIKIQYTHPKGAACGS